MKKIGFQLLILLISVYGCDSSEKKTQKHSDNKPKNSLASCIPEKSIRQGRALSLKVLFKRVSQLKKGESYPDIIKNFGGITRISGYLFDQKNNDIILFGEANDKAPKMLFEDFVVALKNVNNEFAEKKGDTIIYSFPGCSIDMDSSVMAKLNEIENKLNSAKNEKEIKNLEDKWRLVSQLSQKVRVLGVPFNSHFAKLMVDADYDMKLISNGKDSLPINGFLGLTDQRVNLARKGIIFRNDSTLNRFWFCPGITKFSQSGDCFAFCNCEVKLLTELEFLSQSGSIMGTGKASKIAVEFANDFSYHYNEIAELRPKYYELANLFRLFAMAEALYQPSAPSFSSALLKDIWLNWKISNIEVKRSLPGRYNSKSLKLSDLETFYFRSCGGVDMSAQIDSRSFYSDGGSILPALSHAIYQYQYGSGSGNGKGNGNGHGHEHHGHGHQKNDSSESENSGKQNLKYAVSENDTLMIWDYKIEN